MNSIFRSLALAVVIFFAGFAFADTFTYTYTGNSFDTFYGAPPAGLTEIQATFTLSGPLESNLHFTFDGDGNFLPTNIPIVAFNIQANDGVSHLDDTTGLFYIQVETDSGGNINQWVITALNTDSFDTSTLNLGTFNVPGSFVFDLSCRGGVSQAGSDCNNFGFNQGDLGDVGATLDNPGKWTVSENRTAAVPEPGSVILLGSGLLSFAGAVRRKILA